MPSVCAETDSQSHLLVGAGSGSQSHIFYFCAEPHSQLHLVLVFGAESESHDLSSCSFPLQFLGAESESESRVLNLCRVSESDSQSHLLIGL